MTATTEPTAAEIRTWASENGYHVGSRGRIAAHIVEAFKRAHGLS